MSSFTDGKPRVATTEDCQAKWSGGREGEYFRCAFCGRKFQEGDYWRWIYTNDTPGAGGNPIACETCDTHDRESMIAKWKAMHAEVRGRMWWFTQRG